MEKNALWKEWTDHTSNRVFWAIMHEHQLTCPGCTLSKEYKCIKIKSHNLYISLPCEAASLIGSKANLAGLECTRNVFIHVGLNWNYLIQNFKFGSECKTLTQLALHDQSPVTFGLPQLYCPLKERQVLICWKIIDAYLYFRCPKLVGWRGHWSKALSVGYQWRW